MNAPTDANGVAIVGGAQVIRRQNPQAFDADAPAARVLIPGAARSLVSWVGADLKEHMEWVSNADLAVIAQVNNV